MTDIKAEGRLAVGASVPSIQASDSDQNSVSVSYSAENKPTFLYVVSPKCGWCAKNLQNIKTIASSARERYRFIGLSLSDENLQEYIAQSNYGFPIYGGLTSSTKADYKLSATPQTIILSPEGKVLKNWVGAYEGSLLREVEEYFSLRLPGLTDTK